METFTLIALILGIILIILESVIPGGHLSGIISLSNLFADGGAKIKDISDNMKTPTQATHNLLSCTISLTYPLKSGEFW